MLSLEGFLLFDLIWFFWTQLVIRVLRMRLIFKCSAFKNPQNTFFEKCVIELVIDSILNKVTNFIIRKLKQVLKWSPDKKIGVKWSPSLQYNVFDTVRFFFNSLFNLSNLILSKKSKIKMSQTCNRKTSLITGLLKIDLNLRFSQFNILSTQNVQNFIKSKKKQLLKLHASVKADVLKFKLNELLAARQEYLFDRKLAATASILKRIWLWLLIESVLNSNFQ